jgi:hypothetical protein
MMTRWLAGLVVMAAVAVGAATSPRAEQGATQDAQSAGSTYDPPKTPWGDPDIQGGYSNVNENGIPLERPGGLGDRTIDEVEDSELADLIRERNERARASAAGIGGRETGAGPTHWYEHYDARNSRPWMVSDPADGRIPPLTAEAQQRQAGRAGGRGRGAGAGEGGRADSWLDRSLYDRCISRGFPGSMMPAIYGNAYDITQAPGLVAIRYEMIHETRVIPLDDRPRTGLLTHMGEARGHWDGNTLVVETMNLRSPYRGGSPSQRLVERFTPTAPGVIEWSMTVIDPETWTQPWTWGMRLTEDPDQRLFEYACHEGNYAMRNILSAARAEEAAAAAAGR